MFFKGVMILKNVPYFNLISNFGHLEISESGIINLFLNPLIDLIPLVFSPLHRLIIVVITSFLA